MDAKSHTGRTHYSWIGLAKLGFKRNAGSLDNGMAMTSLIANFINWWNKLASVNGKAPFRSTREAADFVSRVHSRNGGPNAKIVAMRKRYEDVNQARKVRLEDRSITIDDTSIRQKGSR